MTKGSDRTSEQKSASLIKRVLTKATCDPYGWTNRAVCFTLRKPIVIPLLDDDDDGTDDENDDDDDVAGEGDDGDGDDDDNDDVGDDDDDQYEYEYECEDEGEDNDELCDSHCGSLLFCHCLRNGEAAKVCDEGQRQDIGANIYYIYQTRPHQSRV